MKDKGGKRRNSAFIAHPSSFIVLLSSLCPPCPLWLILPANRLICNRISNSRFGETFLPQLAGVTAAAGDACIVRRVARVCESIVDAQFHTAADDFGLSQSNER